MVLLRRVIGDALRARRQGQRRTLREVSTAANVSLGYLSEIERGQKEASSELLAAICDALGAQLSDVLRQVTDTLAVAEEMEGVLVPVGDASDAQPGRDVRRLPKQAGPEPMGTVPARTVPASPVPAGAVSASAVSTGKAPANPAPAGSVTVSLRHETPLRTTLRTRTPLRTVAAIAAASHASASRMGKRERDVTYAA